MLPKCAKTTGLVFVMGCCFQVYGMQESFGRCAFTKKTIESIVKRFREDLAAVEKAINGPGAYDCAAVVVVRNKLFEAQQFYGFLQGTVIATILGSASACYAYAQFIGIEDLPERAKLADHFMLILLQQKIAWRMTAYNATLKGYHDELYGDTFNAIMAVDH